MHRRFHRAIISVTALAFVLAGCGGGGGSGSGGSGGIIPTPVPIATPTPGTNAAAFTCPSSATTFAAMSSSSATPSRRALVRPSGPMVDRRLLVVTYDPARVGGETIGMRAATLGAHLGSRLQFAGVSRAARVVQVDAVNADAVAQQLRALPGVVSVAPSLRARALTVNGPYLTNDPYFQGEPGSVAPLYQTDATGGQWDMHIERLGYAFAYSQPNNGSLRTNPNALGSQTVRLAIIDTGEDVTQPDLAQAHVVLARCFITNTAGVQSTGSFVTDPDGHGTDVAGIAGNGTNDGYGFAGAAGNVSLMLYRVFPTPDDNCTSDTTTDPQCGAADVDIASAIDDAVQNGANVINLSLGVASGCTGGQDPSTIEGAAIANAIAHNVIVVAASGNAGSAQVGAPACDPGVIAAGASAYNDGNPNGSNYTGANSEYVASYSQYGATNVPRSASSWGIVAPGGDPAPSETTSTGTVYTLHWIENIWTSTPFDKNFAGDCVTDIFGETNNCRTLIAGTSMATPHVAGAAALVLSVSGVGGPYDSPTAMKQLLCSTADDIGDPHEGCGRLDVYRAVATAIGDPTLP